MKGSNREKTQKIPRIEKSWIQVGVILLLYLGFLTCTAVNVCERDTLE